jgi:hypothetical protein
MLAIERSERASITTGKDVRKNVAEGDPLAVMGIGAALAQRASLCVTRGNVGNRAERESQHHHG